MAISFDDFKGRSGTGGVKIQGLKALKTSFKKLSSKTDSFMTKEIHRAAERIAERANRDVPVDTGKLLRSISVDKGNKSATVKVDAKYASYVERGTKFMDAQPYVLIHVKDSINRMIKNIKRAITL